MSKFIESDVSRTIRNFMMSREEGHRNRQMERNMKVDFDQEDRIIKLLLLGTAESGKTTILKQMKLLHPRRIRYAAQQLCIACKVVKEMGTVVRETAGRCDLCVHLYFPRREGGRMMQRSQNHRTASIPA